MRVVGVPEGVQRGRALGAVPCWRRLPASLLQAALHASPMVRMEALAYLSVVYGDPAAVARLVADFAWNGLRGIRG